MSIFPYAHTIWEHFLAACYMHIPSRASSTSNLIVSRAPTVTAKKSPVAEGDSSAKFHGHIIGSIFSYSEANLLREIGN